MADRSWFDSSSRPCRPTPDVSKQSFSADGGKTWEVNWINTYTRVKNAPDK
jgi:hypothetical protein